MIIIIKINKPNHSPSCQEILLCFLQQKINDLISLELDRLQLPNKSHHWTHLKMQSCLGKLPPLHHKPVIFVVSDFFFLMHVFCWRKTAPVLQNRTSNS